MKFAILIATIEKWWDVKMTLPNRMHGMSGPFNEGKLKICSRCQNRYFKAKIVTRGSKATKVCPNCGYTIRAKSKPRTGIKPKPRPKVKSKTKAKPSR